MHILLTRNQRRATCTRSFCPDVEASGFPCFPAGLDWLVTKEERVFPGCARRGRGALAADLPMVTIPLGVDQPINA